MEPSFFNSELGRKINGTPSIFSLGCTDFVLQYVDKVHSKKKGIFASWQFLFNISDIFHANNDDISLIYFFWFFSYSLAPMLASKNILVMAKKILSLLKKYLFFIKKILLL